MGFSIEDPFGRSRLWLSIRRWANVLIAAMVGTGLILMCLVWQFDNLLAAPPNVMRIALGTGAVCVVWLVGKRGFRRCFRRLQYFLNYPPPWAAGLLGAGGVVFVFATHSDLGRGLSIPDDEAKALRLFGILLAGIPLVVVPTISLILSRILPMLARLWPARSKDLTGRAAGKFVEESTFDEIVQWVKDDSAIEGPETDMFGRGEIAIRIANRLCEPTPQAQAIVGKLGSGKSSLRNLVKRYLSDQRVDSRIAIVEIELWPFANSTAAVDAIIHKLIDALGNYASTIALRGLPGAYTNAMSSAGGFWSALASLQMTPHEPGVILERIDDVATAIGIRLVLWVEDLERFCNSAVAKEEDVIESAEDLARLGPVRALLHGLENRHSITVVTATTTLRNRFDLEKIARFVEFLPELEDHAVARILGKFRGGCRSTKNYIDPASPDIRKSLELLHHPEHLIGRHTYVGPGIYDIVDAILVLCRTPRTVKQGLRKCLDIWEVLVGEIDFDELLILSLLRETNPDAFALVRAWSEFEGLPRSSQRMQKVKEEARQVWDTKLEQLHLSAEHQVAVQYIMRFVYDVPGNGEPTSVGKPQGLRPSGHANYWQRFLSQSIPNDQVPDQVVLIAILDQSEEDSELLKLLENRHASNAVIDFAHLISAERIFRLLVPLVRRRTYEDIASWPNVDPPGLTALGVIWYRQRQRDYEVFSPQRVFGELREALSIAVPVNLTLAISLENMFATVSNREPFIRDVDGLDQPAELKTLLRGLLCNYYTGFPDKLAAALRYAERPTLIWLCWSLDRVRAKDTSGLPFEAWDSFAATVLDATKKCPESMLPQLFSLVTKGVSTPVYDGPVEQQVEFDSKIASQLFGSAETVQDVVRGVDVQSEELRKFKSILLRNQAEGGSSTDGYS